MSFPAQSPQNKERIFFRIPSNICAKILIDGKEYAKVLIDDISSAGLGFNLKEHKGLPDNFHLSFRLPDSLKAIIIEVKVQNRINKRGIIRIGCEYIALSNECKQMINNYIVQLSDFSLPNFMLGIAALLFSLDALLRLFSYSAIVNYSNAPFLKDFAQLQMSPYYILGLSLYAFVCFLALAFSDDMRKKGFLINFSCVSVAFLFVLVKHIFYWKVQLAQVKSFTINPFSWIHTGLLVYAGLAILVALGSFKRVIAVSDALTAYRERHFLGTNSQPK